MNHGAEIKPETLALLRHRHDQPVQDQLLSPPPRPYLVLKDREKFPATSAAEPDRQSYQVLPLHGAVPLCAGLGVQAPRELKKNFSHWSTRLETPLDMYTRQVPAQIASHTHPCGFGLPRPAITSSTRMKLCYWHHSPWQPHQDGLLKTNTPSGLAPFRPSTWAKMNPPLDIYGKKKREARSDGVDHQVTVR